MLSADESVHERQAHQLIFVPSGTRQNMRSWSVVDVKSTVKVDTLAQKEQQRQP